MVGLGCGLAQAQERPPTDGSVSARNAYARGSRHFKDEDYEASLAWMQYAFDMGPQATYAYGVARSLEKLGRFFEAHRLYQSTLKAPRLNRQVRKRATEALRRLAPRLAQAYVGFRARDAEARFQIDDRPVSASSSAFAVEPGPHVLIQRSADGYTLTLWRVTAAAGRITVWPPEAPSARGDAVLPAFGGETITQIDDTTLAIDSKGVRRLSLPVGSHTVGLRTVAGSRVARIEVGSGAVVMIPKATPDASPRPVPTPPGQPEEEKGSTVGGWVTTGLGTGALIAGATLLIIQATDRGSLATAIADTDDRGVIIGVSQVSAQTVYDRADAFRLSGGVLVGVGAAAIIGGVTWLLLSNTDTPPPNATSLFFVPGPTPRVGLKTHF